MRIGLDTLATCLTLGHRIDPVAVNLQDLLDNANEVTNMMIALKKWLYAPLVVALFGGPMAVSATAQVISFSYSQTDLTTGGGTFEGTVDGIFYTGEMPLGTVTQNDGNNRDIPEGMIGYMDGFANPSTNGNDFGMHLGWEGSVTLTGERVVSPTELELYELELDLVIADDGVPGADWSYSAEVTDDDGQGNDAAGDYRIAGWVGEPTQGHRHSGDTRTFVEGEVDNHTMGGSHGQVDEHGRGDALGIGFSFRDGPGENVDEVLPGPVYIDSIVWNGGLTPTNEPTLVGSGSPADFNADGTVDAADFAILAANFNMSGTTRTGGGDLTGDNVTDLHDWGIFRAAYTASQSAGVAAIPEPSTMTSVLLGLGLLPLARRRRR